MIIQTILFYIFSIFLIISSLMVVSSKNPVHSVLYLILAFFNSAALFVMLKAEFVAMLLVIVYVGAVAVLFLFVVMMIDINFAELRKGFVKYSTIGVIVGSIIFAEFLFAFFVSSKQNINFIKPNILLNSNLNNSKIIGNILYTEYFYPFQLSGLILLVAMIGAIILTLRRRKNVKKQDSSVQFSRDKKDTLEIIDVNFNQGINKVYFNDRKSN